MPFRTPKTPQWPHEYVFALSTCATGTTDGLTVHLTRGQVWRATDPIVRDRSWLFVGEPPDDMLCSTLPDSAGLEAALAQGQFAEEVADADRNAPRSTLVPF
jgi:hypothetical protein